VGGEVYKVLISPSGGWKIQGYYSCPGYRVILFFRSGEWTFYHYGFTKSARANINEKELQAHKETAKELLGLTEEQLKYGCRMEL
jgi:hypothetical protein